MPDRRGGPIPPDGRQARPPGVGKYAKRHDLERPKTPGLADPSIQYGDVQRLEAGQRIIPIPDKGGLPAGGGGRPGPVLRGGGGLTPPDPLEFATRRLGGTLDTTTPRTFGVQRFDTAPWVNIIRRIANAPGASGLLRNAFVAKLGELARAPAVVEAELVDFGDLENFLEGFNDGL